MTPPSDAYDDFFESLLPAIETNVRNNEMLAPVLIMRTMDGREFVQDMGRFFSEDHPDRKNAIIPLVNLLFTTKAVAMVALISECWITKLDTPAKHEEYERIDAAGGGVSDHTARVDGVIVTIYGRDKQDKSYSLRIKTGRSGVERYLKGPFPQEKSSGRLVRDNPMGRN